MDVSASSLEGFALAAEEFCSLENDVQKQLCTAVAKFVLGLSTEYNTDTLLKYAEAAGCQCDRRTITNVNNLILQLYRTAQRENLNGSQLSDQLLSGSAWIPSSRDVVSDTWSQLMQVAPSASQFVNLGQLVDMEWTFGMSMASSSCRNLNSPFVAVLLKIAESSGQVVSRSFEMTLPEFRDFSRQIREMAQTLETA